MNQTSVEKNRAQYPDLLQLVRNNPDEHDMRSVGVLWRFVAQNTGVWRAQEKPTPIMRTWEFESDDVIDLARRTVVIVENHCPLSNPDLQISPRPLNLLIDYVNVVLEAEPPVTKPE